jgi:glycosyltransferase involved in cell wall biosynthesis
MEEMTASLIVFTLNEIDGMKSVMPKIDKSLFKQIIIVDGGSTDGTVEWAEREGYYVFRQTLPGTNGAFLEAIKKVKTRAVITFSPDGNSDPECLRDLIAQIEYGADICIASRYLPPAKSYDDDLITSFGNWMFTKLFNSLFGSHLSDVLVIYRSYYMPVLNLLDIDTKLDAWGTQILARAVKAKYTIKEIPADEPKRIGGVRKMQPLKNGWWELKTMFKEWYGNKTY